MTERKAELFIDWKRAVDCKDTSVTLPLGTEWLLQYQADYHSIVPFKRCYHLATDSFKWVPMSQAFESIADAQAAVQRYLKQRHPTYLNIRGEVIET